MLGSNYKKFVFFIVLIFVQPAFSEETFYLSADKIIKNDKSNTILAKGNVEIHSGKIKTRSDLLEFNTKINQITLEGNVKISGAKNSLIQKWVIII